MRASERGERFMFNLHHHILDDRFERCVLAPPGGGKDMAAVLHNIFVCVKFYTSLAGWPPWAWMWAHHTPALMGDARACPVLA